MKAVMDFPASPLLRHQIESSIPDWLEVSFGDYENEAQLERSLANADVLLHVLQPVNQDLMMKAPSLKLVQKIGVGVNTIDLSAAAARGIRVANMPGTNSIAVSEATIALMLAVLRRLAPLNAATCEGNGWVLAPDATDNIGELSGRTVGLLGCGAIPRLLIPILRAFGSNVQFWSRAPVSDMVIPQVDFETLVSTSDIVSLHLPLNDDTRNIINSSALDLMRPGSILINTARGPLVDEGALIKALSSGKLRGAGLDVFAQEPTPNDNPLLSMSNVIVTPHVAWLTAETIGRSMCVIVENCTRLRDGSPLLNEIALEKPIRMA